MYYLFICCRDHYIKIGKFQSFDMAEREAKFHSANCGDSILFEIWHKQTCIGRYVNETI